MSAAPYSQRVEGDARIDLEVLSINPFWYRKDRDTAAAIVKVNRMAVEHDRQSAGHHHRAAASDLRGTLDKFPGLKIIAAHGGGYLGACAPRSDHACFVSPVNCNPDIVLKKKPTEYLNQIHFDALVFTEEALRHLVAQVGPSQVVLGTDHPIPWEEHPVDHVMATTTLSLAQRAAILGGNAARLLNIKDV